MKLTILGIMLLVLSACATGGGEKMSIQQGVAQCNAACEKNPNVAEFSSKAGGGMPLLFFGGMEQRCRCKDIKL